MSAGDICVLCTFVSALYPKCLFVGSIDSFRIMYFSCSLSFTHSFLVAVIVVVFYLVWFAIFWSVPFSFGVFLYRGFPRSHRLYYIEHTHTKWKHNNQRNNQWQQWQQQYQSNKCLTMINLFGTENSVFILFWMNALHVDVCVSTRVEYGLVLYISKSNINS